MNKSATISEPKMKRRYISQSTKRPQIGSIRKFISLLQHLA